MSHTIRGQVWRAMVDELNRDRPPDIPKVSRRRWQPGDRMHVPSLAVLLLREPRREAVGRRGGVKVWDLNLGIQVVAPSADPDGPEDALEPILAYCSERLGDSNLGGLVHELTETETVWDVVDGDQYYAIALSQWVATYQTLRSDRTRSQ